MIRKPIPPSSTARRAPAPAPAPAAVANHRDEDDDDDDDEYEDASPAITKSTPSPVPYTAGAGKSALARKLIETFTAVRIAESGYGGAPCVGIDVHKVQVIDAFEKMMIALGMEPKHIFSGGKLLEIVKAEEMGATLNRHMNGPDVFTSDGRPVELKNSKSALGVKANFSFTLPKRRTNERAEDYYKRVDAEFERKGTVKMTHFYATGERNEYELTPEFLAFYCRTKNVIGSDKINIGAVSCVRCKRIHRLCKLMEYEKIWKEEQRRPNAPKQNWKALLLVPVEQTCPAAAPSHAAGGAGAKGDGKANGAKGNKYVDNDDEDEDTEDEREAEKEKQERTLKYKLELEEELEYGFAKVDGRVEGAVGGGAGAKDEGKYQNGDKKKHAKK